MAFSSGCHMTAHITCVWCHGVEAWVLLVEWAFIGVLALALGVLHVLRREGYHNT